VTLLVGALLLAACAATDGGEKSEAAAARVERVRQQRALLLAERKLAQAELEQKAARAKGDAAIEQAKKELELAENALAQFQKLEGPQRLRKAELDVREKENQLAENQEEFEQLKLLYAEQDLADQTREMVIHRTERRLEQSRLELELARAGIEKLRQDDLAIERGKLELEVSEKQQALAEAQMDARVAWNAGEVELLEAQQALAEAQESRTKDAGGE
jgi:hypothetical protein